MAAGSLREIPSGLLDCKCVQFKCPRPGYLALDVIQFWASLISFSILPNRVRNFDPGLPGATQVLTRVSGKP